MKIRKNRKARNCAVVVWGGAHGSTFGHLVTSIILEDSSGERTELELSSEDCLELERYLLTGRARIEAAEAFKKGLPSPWDFCDLCGVAVHTTDSSATRYTHEGATQHHAVHCARCKR